jgi:DNA-binding GntR family transcriptional regulator
VDRLRKDITSGFFNPGERINEAEVSERYGVSRTPIREAIRQLERDGLVSAQRYRGATVVKLDDAKVAALFETREAVEGMAARLAARHLPQAKSAEILSALNEHRDQLHSDMTIRPPVDLHQVVLKECRNAYLMATMERLRDMLATLRAESVRVVTRRRQSSTEHLAIAVCLYEGDEDAAEAAMRVHIRSVCRNVLNQRLGAEGRDG